MVPLSGQATVDWIENPGDAPHRSTALRHASIHDRPGLWGDDRHSPSSVVWLREGDEGGWEAFAEGVPGSTLAWLATRSRGRPIALLAPPSWERSVRAMGGRVESGVIRTWLLPERSHPASPMPTIEVRRLTLEDGPAFEATAPAWALRSWGDFRRLISPGVAFGVRAPGVLAATAWTYESDHGHDKIAVATWPRFRRLGLGRAVASTLVDHILSDRRKSPLWVTTRSNLASIALARSLGFATPVIETLLRWTPPPG